LRPIFFQGEKDRVLKAFPALKPVMEAFERHYIRVEYSAHDRSLMERIARNITEQDAYVYGMTPWQTFLKIAATLEIGPDDIFIEPGCGTGHLCFFINQAYGIRVIGIEAIADFITTAQTIRRELIDQGLDLSRLAFYNLDFFTSDLSRGTLFYIAGTCFPDDYRIRLLEKIAAEAAVGSTVITLTHAIEHPAYALQHKVEGLFSWGRDKALIYRLQPQTDKVRGEAGPLPEQAKDSMPDQVNGLMPDPASGAKLKDSPAGKGHVEASPHEDFDLSDQEKHRAAAKPLSAKKRARQHRKHKRN
jgi:hypothetical protein